MKKCLILLLLLLQTGLVFSNVSDSSSSKEISGVVSPDPAQAPFPNSKGAPPDDDDEDVIIMEEDSDYQEDQGEENPDHK